MPSVSSVTKMWSRNASSATATDRFQKLGVMFEEAYQVLCSPDCVATDIYAALPVSPGQSYPTFEWAYAEQAKLTQVSPILWIAGFTYSGEFSGLYTNGQPKSPMNAAPIIRLGGVQSYVEVDTDYNGLPFTSTLGGRFKGVQRLVSDQTLNVRRNFQYFDSYIQGRYLDSTNSDTFFGWPPGTAKMMEFRADRVNGEAGYWDVEAVIQFRIPYNTTPERAWWARYLNQDMIEKLTGTPFPILAGLVVQATNPDGTFVTEPIALKEDGTRASPDGSDNFWVERQLYDSLPFNSLGLL